MRSSRIYGHQYKQADPVVDFHLRPYHGTEDETDGLEIHKLLWHRRYPDDSNA